MYRYYRNSPSFKTPKYFYKESEIDFSLGEVNYEYFLLQEFFNANEATKKNFYTYYESHFGSGALAYLKRKTIEWANGYFQVTPTMRGRITSAMPKFLTADAKFKLSTLEFMDIIKSSIRAFLHQQDLRYTEQIIYNPRVIVELFHQEVKRINTLEIKNLRYNIITDEEKYEAIEISKYILRVKLQISFDQIRRDFNAFLPFMVRLKRGIFSTVYNTNIFKLKFDITKTGVSNVTLPAFVIEEIEANSRFKIFADKYLAHELVNTHQQAKKATVNAFLNSYDLNEFFNQYGNFSKSKIQRKIKSEFVGEGGILEIDIQIKPLRILILSFIISLAKLAFYIACIFKIADWLFSSKFSLLSFIFILAMLLFFNFFKDEIKNLKLLALEIKRYGL